MMNTASGQGTGSTADQAAENAAREPVAATEHGPSRTWSPFLFWMGVAALAVAAGYYLLCRDILANVLPEWDGFGLGGHSLCRTLGFLPSLSHAFAFVLLCSSLFPDSRKLARVFCAMWMLVNIGSELLQSMEGFRRGRDVIDGSRLWFGGVFDVYDVVAALVGALTAYFLFLHQFKTRGGIDA